MAIPDFNTFKTKRTAPWQRIRFSKGTTRAQTPTASLYSWWLVAPFAGAAPTTAAVTTRATTGALGQQNSAGTMRCVGSNSSCGSQDAWQETHQGNQGFAASFIVADRLCHQGGLASSVKTAQTTNLPTAALTRYTSGVGVCAALENYATIGTTSVTATCSYTNQAGTAGQTSPAFKFAGDGTQSSKAGAMFPMPLASGDSGVRAVASVTLSATSSPSGSFGVTLYVPLFVVPLRIAQAKAWTSVPVQFDAFLDGGANLSVVLTDACLWPVSYAVAADSPGTNFIAGSALPIYGEILLAED